MEWKLEECICFLCVDPLPSAQCLPPALTVAVLGVHLQSRQPGGAFTGERLGGLPLLRVKNPFIVRFANI